MQAQRLVCHVFVLGCPATPGLTYEVRVDSSSRSVWPISPNGVVCDRMARGFWLQALRSAFSVNGYCSGVVSFFSIRHPSTRTWIVGQFLPGFIPQA